MHHCATHRCPRTRRLLPILLACASLSVVMVATSGCSRTVKKPAPVARYATRPLKKVAPILKDSLFEKTEMANTDPYLVSGYGLVANLDNTGGSEAPRAVRDYMYKQLQQHRFNSPNQPGFENVSPDRVLRDRRFAIVRVDGLMPPGIREGEFFDINVSALPESSVTSLARGDLYRTDL